MILQDSIEINAPAGEVFDKLTFFMSDQEHYRRWHPGHTSLKWIKGPPVTEGSVVYIEEYTGEILQKLKFRFVKIVPGRLVVYKVTFPLNLFAPENRFEITDTGPESCRFKAWGKIRMKESTFLKMSKAHPAKLRRTLQHMREEGENLKRACEL